MCLVKIAIEIEKEEVVVVNLLAFETGAIPETVRLKRTANKDNPPTYIGKLRTKSSFLDTQSAIHSLRGFGPLYPLPPFISRHEFSKWANNQ